MEKQFIALQEQLDKITRDLQNRSNTDNISNNTNTNSDNAVDNSNNTSEEKKKNTSFEDILKEMDKAKGEEDKQTPSSNSSANIGNNTKELIAKIYQKAAEPLIEKMQNGSTSEKLEAILETIHRRERNCIPALTEALKDSDDTIRSFAAKALGALGAKESIPKLVATVSDSNELVRKSAAETLSILTGKSFKSIQDLSEKEWEKLLRFKKQN